MVTTLSPEAADWYSGNTLAKSMAGLIDTISTVTERNWHPEHTGGGCFWIACHLTHDADGMFLALTGSDGPLRGDDTVAQVEAEETGWIIGVYDASTDDGTVNNGDYIYHGPFSTEELPLRARDIINDPLTVKEAQ